MIAANTNYAPLRKKNKVAAGIVVEEVGYFHRAHRYAKVNSQARLREWSCRFPWVGAEPGVSEVLGVCL